MTKPLLVLVIIMVLLTLVLCGCNEGQNDLDRFVGVWEGEISTYSFYSNRTCKIGAFNGTYRLDEETLVVDIDEGEGPIQGPVFYNYSFSNNDNTLTLTELSLGITAVYIKQ